MKKLSILYGYLLIVCSLFFSACKDNAIEFPDDSLKGDSNIEGEYALQFILTLDNMGGGIATRADNPMAEIENYVDLEKVRILFFTCVKHGSSDDIDECDKKVSEDVGHDYFLFEPKNHWVKKIDPDNNHKNPNRWLVSIPMYTHGNNSGDFNWDWDFIRERLTTAPFKIAILANRPEYDYVDEFSGNQGQALIPAGWMENKGPYWTSENVYSPENLENNSKEIKDVFDLHHCQFDINYINKSTDSKNLYYGFYSFVMSDWGYEDGKTWNNIYTNGQLDIDGTGIGYRPKMGATASWVDWEYKGNEKGFLNTSNSEAKRFRLPSLDYPIPMYGIQRFDPIQYSDGKPHEDELWLKGSPFYLSPGIPGQEPLEDDGVPIYDQKTISLLRSVVKMELFIPKTYTPQMVGVCYSNIYSRCDPMDVWTPTDKLWDDVHINSNGSYTGGGKCELESIMKYGSICTTDGINPPLGVEAYQEALSWYYGVWKEKAWSFNDFGKEKVVAEDTETGMKYPRIFNSTIQRNQLVICDSNSEFSNENDPYWHYIIYCGEKNIMDPSSLYQLHGRGAGNSMFQYWLVQLNNQVYGVTATDYGNTSNPVHDVKAIPTGHGKNGHTTSTNLSYMSNHQAESTAVGNSPTSDYTSMQDYYQQQITDNPKNQSYLPWPLIRNHVYRITLSKTGSGGSASGRSTDDSEAASFKISCEDFHSSSI